ncbi:fibrous sheath CABYR-binding protein-like [Culicoides brevitarsis]|uniref:fibrous sheath CABYR-binding protein-like n=1 Tax=Culicoides brevitarsis TaxID=469753 RepID=UPI00307BFE6F
MDTNSVSPLPPPEAPLAMMEGEKTPPRSPGAGGEAGDGALPPPPDENDVSEEAPPPEEAPEETNEGEEPPGSDDSHATVVQSVTEENERSPSSGSKKSGNNDDEELHTLDAQKPEDVIVLEDIEDEPSQEELPEPAPQAEDEPEEQEEEEEFVPPPPEPEPEPEPEEPEDDDEIEEILLEEVPPPEIEEITEEPEESESVVETVEELPPPPAQFTSSTEATSAPETRTTNNVTTATVEKPTTNDHNNDADVIEEEHKKAEKPTTTTIDIEPTLPTIKKIDSTDLKPKKQELPQTTKVTTTTNECAPSTSTTSAANTSTSVNNDSQIITVPIFNEPEMPTVLEKKPLPDISSNRRYDDDPDKIWNCGAWFEYILVVVVSSLLLLAATVLTLFWAIYYRQGFDLTDADKKFNLHPVLMVGGYITLSGFSIILYRICRCCSHLMVKLIHALFHALAIPCIVIGFLVVWDYKNQTGAAHFYSLHSWLGLITMGLFALQFVLGFFSFLILLCCDNATYKFRSVMVPIHAIFGIITFMLAIATALTGFLQKARFDLGSDYNLFAEEGIIVNTIGVVLIGLGCIVPFAVRRANSPANSRVYVSERL